MGKNDKDKIGGVSSTRSTKNVERAGAVSEVEEVKGADSVGKVGGVDGKAKRRPTRTMTLAEREQLFKMINEEADKLFENSGMDDDKKEAVREAVKMAVDSGLLPEEDS